MLKKEKKFKFKYLLIFLGLILIVGLSFFYFYKQKEIRPIYSLEQREDLAPLIEKASRASFVLLGESTHGTSEYYLFRSLISQELITKHDFRIIVVEGDWDALYKINAYVKNKEQAQGGARVILESFDRWPTWMWANEEFLDFVEWLRIYNLSQPLEKKVGVYGKDIYGGLNSMALVLEYLASESQDLELIASEAYACLAKYDYDWGNYIRQLALGANSCQEDIASVINILNNLNKDINDQAYFNALQNAWIVAELESHFRAELLGPSGSWNARVMGMKNIFNRLKLKYGEEAKSIIWAHNTHVGDARATEMKDSDLVNIGQLLRERYGDEDVFIVGFGTYRGTVMAGLKWGEPGQVLIFPQARVGSLESFLALQSDKDFYIFLDENWEETILAEKIGHRAKGVVYNPINDARQYVETIATERYNAFIFLHQTKALTPLTR